MLYIHFAKLDVEIKPLSLVLTETLNEISFAKIKIIVDQCVEPRRLLQQNITVTIKFKKSNKIWQGSITAVQKLGNIDRNKYVLDIRAKDDLYNLHQQQHSRSFVKTNSIDIAKKIAQTKKLVLNTTVKRDDKPYIVQLQETDFAFINRKLSYDNILFYCQHNQLKVNEINLVDTTSQWQDARIHDDQIQSLNYIQNENSNLFKFIIDTRSVNLNQKLNIQSIDKSLYPYRITYYVNDDANTPFSKKLNKQDDFLCKIMATDSLRSLFELTQSHADVYYPSPDNAGVFTGEVLNVASPSAKVWFSWDENNTEKQAYLCPDVSLYAQQSSTHKHIHFLPKQHDRLLLQYLNNDCEQPHIVGAYYQQPPLTDNAVSLIQYQKENTKRSLIINDNDHSEGLAFVSTDNIALKSDHSIAMHSDNVYQATSDKLTIESNKNDCIISAKKQIQIKAGASSITITPSLIAINSPSILLNAGASSLTGAIAVKGAKHTCPKETAKIPHQGGPIIEGSSNVFINGKAVSRVGDKLQCYNSTDRTVKGHPNLFINNKPAALESSTTEHGGRIEMDDQSVQAQSGRVASEKTVLQDAKASYLEMDIRIQHLPKATINAASLVIANTKTKQTQMQAVDIETNKVYFNNIKAGEYDCYLQTDNGRAYEIVETNSVRQLPYYKTKLLVKATGTELAPEIIKLTVLPTLMVLNYRDQMEDPTVSDDWLNVFKKQDNEVTLFIHGFNVPAGALDNAIAGVANKAEPTVDKLFTPLALAIDIEKALSKQTLLKADVLSTVFRDKKILQQQIHHSVDDIPLNGTGAYNWFLNIENNLLTAAGKDRYEIKDYEDYKRCLHVSWPGNPSQAVDYMEAVPNAFAVGEKLSSVIVNLKKQGLTINVIAHSLGNAVLYSTLAALSTLQAEAIDHAFMWEPAIPCDVFNRPKPIKNKKDLWYRPGAIKGAKKITVLFSRNDNVVGPIPPNQKNQLAINKAKPLIGEFIPAYIFTHMGVTSLYHLAMWIGVPALSLFKPSVQEYLYQHILNGYPDKKVMGDLTHFEKQDWVNRGYYLPALKEQQYYSMQLNKHEIDQFEEKLKSLESGLNDWLSKLGWGEKTKIDQLRDELVIHSLEGLFNVQVGSPLFKTLLLDVPADIFLPQLINIVRPSFDNIFYRIVTLLHMFLDVVPEPVPAMGAVGATTDAVTNIDQSDYLWSHSGMRNPTKEILQRSYGLMV